jgi:hypothetical protein
MYSVTFCPQVQVTLPNLNFEAQEMERLLSRDKLRLGFSKSNLLHGRQVDLLGLINCH